MTIREIGGTAVVPLVNGCQYALVPSSGPGRDARRRLELACLGAMVSI